MKKGSRMTEEQKQRIRDGCVGRPSSFKGKKHTEESLQKMRAAQKGHPGHPSPQKGRPLSEETKDKISAALKGKPHTEEHNQRMRDALKGKPKSAEHRQHMSDAQKGKPRNTPAWNKGKHLSEEHKQKLRGRPSPMKGKPGKPSPFKGTHTGKPSWNKGKRMSEEQRQKLSAARTGQKLSEEQKQARRENPRFIAARSHFRRTNGATAIELFILHCLSNHGGHRFERESEIPGFFESAGRHHVWDFLLPDKKLAVELDGKYWHSFQNPNGWDVAREYDNEHHAEWLGWRTVRILERVLRQSKPFKVWLRARYREQREIRAACKPPRLHINLATKAVKAKRAHFDRVRLRKAA